MPSSVRLRSLLALGAALVLGCGGSPAIDGTLDAGAADGAGGAGGSAGDGDGGPGGDGGEGGAAGGGAGGGGAGGGGAGGGAGGAGGSGECVTNAQCQDGLHCNGSEVCDAGTCIPGTPVLCDDGVDCTVDTCDEGTNACVSTPDDAKCADANACTTDVCVSAVGCTHQPDDAACDDLVHCNGQEWCDPAPGAGCKPGSPVVCPVTDGHACTHDVCDEVTDTCKIFYDHAACPGEFCSPAADPADGCAPKPPCDTDADCTDGDACNGTETCDADKLCSPGVPPDCDDGKVCTLDACDPVDGTCSHTPNHASCNDQNSCTTTDACDPAHPSADATTGCVNADPPSCDDGRSCTQDLCDPANGGSCKHVPNDAACGDNKFCNGTETCDPLGPTPTGCVAGTPPDCSDGIPCTSDTCSNASGSCLHAPNDVTCQDSSYCNGAEVCQVGVGCVGGSPVVCNDNNPCTVDTCSEVAKSCTYTADDSMCDNGQHCDGVEKCNSAPGGGCQSGIPVSCPSDSYACTVDACDEATKSCKSTASDALCTDPAKPFCKPEPQSAPSGCKGGTPCPGGTDAECDDGSGCNGIETCGPDKLCKPGVPLDCDDGVACTQDSCVDPAGTCQHVQNHALCDDGAYCNGTESCSPQFGCVSLNPPVCDDGVACTYDYCDEATKGCKVFADHGYCDDGKLCNGAEVCQVGVGCTAASQPYVCPSDGVACTSDVCDPNLNGGAGGCKHAPNDALCPCGQTCNKQSGCGNWCTVTACGGQVYQCGDCLDNDGDCKIDSYDTQCMGVCDNTEGSYYIGISGASNASCKQDCYYDSNSGNGNDTCFWNHECDPFELGTPKAPESACTYNPNANTPGTSLTCQQMQTSQQSQLCLDYCGSLTPNGCDCFGCCQIPIHKPCTSNANCPSGSTCKNGGCSGTVQPCTTRADCPATTYGNIPNPPGPQDEYECKNNLCIRKVWLHSEPPGTPSNTGTCTEDTINDPAKCLACTQVQGACLNDCSPCEVCFGAPPPDPDVCDPQVQCPPDPNDPDVVACGLPGQPPCAAGYWCVSGCCQFKP